ncbi:uncharacterized protein PHACADRAFT_144077 [Phanerochaete carnosa HHB-10118-sp]|uniref:Thioredoxin domain-containing protein n=1 Tax=Phanerochaete carnosa (strain HHB-10118-sp) TaxID=650164 RepID=K5VVJ2_PHACS|nr:uncharacterized protein PHACADRAFT_144077 [Phanerochaete carnosa HHB-10118-sp]EKM55563.1 hypothetical protein PHACADRAFT_144077 [Phanerochaete carnosa HHB-10118-sp]
MLLLPLLTLLALPFCQALISKDQAREELTKLAAANNGVVNVDEHTFELLTLPDREWSSTIVFTAMDPRRKCGPCKGFQPAYDSVAKAWTKVAQEHRNQHFFGYANFEDAMTVFQKVGIQSAPLVYLYPATEGPYKAPSGRTTPLVYDFSGGFDAEPLAQYLSRHTPVPIPYKPPVDWMKYATIGATLLIAVTALRVISPLLKSRWVWAIGTVLTILTMTGGFMFVRIREMPYTGNDGQWIAAGYQNQFGQETQVVGLLYGLLSASFLMLTMVAPYQTSPRRQQWQVWLWSAVICIIFSVLVSLFRVKNRGYPFKLLI